MAWARIDDGFHSHPKIAPLSLAARGLFVTAISYSAHYLTDGVVARDVIRAHSRGHEGRRALRELIAAGLLSNADGDYAIHDFLDFNPSRGDVEAARERERVKKARRRTAQREAWSFLDHPPSLSPGDSSGVSPRESGLGGGSTSTTTENGGESRVPRVLEILGSAPRFELGPSTAAGVDSALRALPDRDPVAAAHEAVAWVSDPSFRKTSAVGVFLDALRHQPPAARRVDETVRTCRCGARFAPRGRRKHAGANVCDGCMDRIEARALGEEAIA